MNILKDEIIILVLLIKKNIYLPFIINSNKILIGFMQWHTDDGKVYLDLKL